jgi:hypothetical protein
MAPPTLWEIRMRMPGFRRAAVEGQEIPPEAVAKPPRSAAADVPGPNELLFDIGVTIAAVLSVAVISQLAFLLLPV